MEGTDAGKVRTTNLNRTNCGLSYLVLPLELLPSTTAKRGLVDYALDTVWLGLASEPIEAIKKYV